MSAFSAAQQAASRTHQLAMPTLARDMATLEGPTCEVHCSLWGVRQLLSVGYREVEDGGQRRVVAAKEAVSTRDAMFREHATMRLEGAEPA